VRENFSVSGPSKGGMWPGVAISSPGDSEFMAMATARARSAAELPEAMPRRPGEGGGAPRRSWALIIDKLSGYTRRCTMDSQIGRVRSGP
jgi:hypothetical protein